MINLQAEVEKISQRLMTLPKREAVDFLVFQCTRMMTCLVKFGQETGFETSHYQNCVNFAWDYLEGNPLQISFEQASLDCYDNAPDTEIFDHELVSAALSAALGVGMLMEFIHTDERQLVADANQLVFDAVVLHLQATEAPFPLSLSNEEIYCHPAMRREVMIQSDALQFFVTGPNLGEVRKYIARTDIELLP
ncbi:DUF416 family protein [Massilia sp. TWP1-3-3]|uniref:DUF416 family protein n=1 Tax=Massilia sp. TWP1-3-3 TaxID=2804573 RepID=UPI003CE9BE31